MSGIRFESGMECTDIRRWTAISRFVEVVGKFAAFAIGLVPTYPNEVGIRKPLNKLRFAVPESIHPLSAEAMRPLSFGGCGLARRHPPEALILRLLTLIFSRGLFNLLSACHYKWRFPECQ